MGGRALILAYHNVVPDEDARRRPHTLHLSLTDFRRHLDLLSRFAQVIPLDEVLDEPGLHVKGRHVPRVCLTFDDAYTGMLELAAPELVDRKMPATIFVCPGLLSEPSFWWDVVEASADEAGLVFRDLEGRGDRIRSWAAREGRVGSPPSRWRTPGSLELLSSALKASSGKLVAGAHSWDHPSLAALDGAPLKSQLERPLAWIEQQLFPTTRWLAYPYGHVTRKVRDAARRAGYTGGLEIAGGWVHPRGGDRWATPRLNIPAALSDEGFILRLSGVIRR